VKCSSFAVVFLLFAQASPSSRLELTSTRDHASSRLPWRSGELSQPRFDTVQPRPSGGILARHYGLPRSCHAAFGAQELVLVDVCFDELARTGDEWAAA
jgi:hypothetical protein